MRLSIIDPLKRHHIDEKVVGLTEGVKRTVEPETFEGSFKVRYEQYHGDIPLEDDEKYARSKVESRSFILFLVGYYTACKIFLFYLISLSSLLTVILSVVLTLYYYELFQSDPNGHLNAGGLDWVLLGFAVVTPLSLTIGTAFRRREQALIEIAKFRSFSFQLFVAHCLWDWDEPSSANEVIKKDVDRIGHVDDVLTELIAIGDELCRFLTLPTTSRSRHRVTRNGRREAARTAEVAYRLYESLYTKRMIRLSILSGNSKRAGLPSGEVSRIRQYERFMGEAIENLRMIKNYRTPQTLRSFARIFTTLLPPFFAPTYAEIAINVNSLALGITFAVITSLCLNALHEGVEILEDPFVAFVTLDGIDVREEFQVLHWHQLVNTRNSIFSLVTPYEGPRKNAFFVSSNLSDDPDKFAKLPSEEKNAKSPLGTDSESSTGRHRKKIMRSTTHQRVLSLGDANLLSHLEEGIDPFTQGREHYRKSGYILLDQQKTEAGRMGANNITATRMKSSEASHYDKERNTSHLSKKDHS